MKKYIALFLAINSLFAYGQIGINTENPQQLFHIDGKSTVATTNPTTGTPTEEQQKDDFVVTNDGNVGIGTIYPSAKIEINTDINQTPGFKLVDGTQKNLNVLTSDDAGVGQWKPLDIPIYQIKLRDFADYQHPANLGEIRYTGVNFETPPGEWLITFTIGVELTPVTEPTNSYVGTNMIRIRLMDTATPSSLSYLPTNTVNEGSDLYPRLASTGFSVIMTQGTFIGYLAVNNTTGAKKTYYLFVDNAATNFQNSFYLRFKWNETYANFFRIQPLSNINL